MEIIALPIQAEDAKVDSRFRLVMAAAHRVRQLNTGIKPLADSKHYKNTSVALDEILQGKTDILQGEEARKLISAERAVMEEKRAAAASAEDVFVLRRKAEKRDEIEAELKQYIDDRTAEEGEEGGEAEVETSEESSEEGDEW
ncbi:MAG: DNA-directed RNA polymerase subunit omega [Nitrospirota bacterium]|nr:DNA-directed RNA polymerase subunit omega [Nitrospirota bacterium]